MNRELLETEMVKQDVKRWYKEGYSLSEILTKLGDIHLIVISPEELEEFISKYVTD